jgi:thiol:disulfide interchange protein DsbD
MKNLIIACLLLLGFSVNAQVLDPITWNHEVNKISDDEYELIVNADFEPGWHIYSQFLEFGEDEIGPIPTEVEFFDSEGNYELIGKTSEPDTKPVFDKAFGMEISYFGGQKSSKDDT